MGKNMWSMLMDLPGFVGARIPGDVFYFFDDFLKHLDFSDTTDIAAWDVHRVSGQTSTGLSILDGIDDTPALAGGMLSMVTEGTTDDGDSLQVNGEAFHLKAGYPIYFETRFRVKDVDKASLFIGLCVADEDIITNGVTDKIGILLSGTKFYADAEKDSNAKDVEIPITPSDANFQTFAFAYDGANSVKFFMGTNGSDLVCYAELHPETIAHYIPDDVMMTPSIEFITENAAVETCYVDYVFCAQKRYKLDL